MKVILFGAGRFANLVRYCLTHDSPSRVAGFTVDDAHWNSADNEGLPLAKFGKLEDAFNPGEYALLVCIGPHDGNRLRRDRFNAARARGYSTATYVSSRASTWPDLRVGTGSLVFDGAVIQPFAKIGINAVVRSSVHVSHHVEIGDHCFVAAGACFGGNVVVEERAFVGLNATIRDGVRLAEGCFVAAGAVVVRDTEPNSLYAGAPARRVRTLTAD
jgi:sugar O-acyltransferase (sialic acid O-acetyltransferase NeuD family)